MASTVPLSPTPRTQPTRAKKRFSEDRAALNALLDLALVGHLGVQVGDHPVVLPMAFGVDLDGPDEGGTIYAHASVAAGWAEEINGANVCFTVTEVDGIVVSRSRKRHSMNYRCAVVVGAARVVTDDTERSRGLTAIVEHLVPGQTSALRPDNRKELAAVTVVAIPLTEASLKVRNEEAGDEPEDVLPDTWAGVIPLRRVAAEPITNANADGQVPHHILDRVGVINRATPPWTDWATPGEPRTTL